MCYPGTWGYESILPDELRKSLWIKCMNSPIWIRDNIGESNEKPGLPYSDSDKFGDWLLENVGNRKEVTPIVFGLTIDCCVLSTLQELSWRGYYPLVVKEAVDHKTGNIKDRDELLKLTIPNWADIIEWKELVKKQRKNI